MITNNPTPRSLVYRLFTIEIERQGDLAILRWQSASGDYTATQQVVGDEWTDGELIRFAMDAVDIIWKHWNRLEFQTATRREDV